MKKNKFITLLFVFIALLSIFMIPVSAASHTLVGSVTDNTSQIRLLVSTMLNQPDWDLFAPWQAGRVGDQDYMLWYNISDENTASYIRYHQIGTGYLSNWVLNFGSEEDFSLNKVDFNTVGNIEGDLASELYNNYVTQKVTQFSLVILVFALLYFVFRIRLKRGGDISL